MMQRPGRPRPMAAGSGKTLFQKLRKRRTLSPGRRPRWGELDVVQRSGSSNRIRGPGCSV